MSNGWAIGSWLPSSMQIEYPVLVVVGSMHNFALGKGRGLQPGLLSLSRRCTKNEMQL